MSIVELPTVVHDCAKDIAPTLVLPGDGDLDLSWNAHYVVQFGGLTCSLVEYKPACGSQDGYT